MKNTIALIALIAAAISGCQTTSNRPEGVDAAFLDFARDHCRAVSTRLNKKDELRGAGSVFSVARHDDSMLVASILFPGIGYGNVYIDYETKRAGCASLRKKISRKNLGIPFLSTNKLALLKDYATILDERKQASTQ